MKNSNIFFLLLLASVLISGVVPILSANGAEIDPTQSVYAYTSTERGIMRGSSMHLAVNIDGTITPLNFGLGVLYANGTPSADNPTLNFNHRSMLNPWIFRMVDGKIGIVAQNATARGTATDNGKLAFWTTTDLVHYTFHGLLDLGTTDAITAPQVSFDDDTQRYIITWIQSGGVREVSTAKLEMPKMLMNTVTEANPTKFTAVAENSTRHRASYNAIPGLNGTVTCIFALTRAEEDYLIRKLSEVKNVSAEPLPKTINLKAGDNFSAENLPATLKAHYSDGSANDIPIDWNVDDLAAVKTSEPGTFTVKGSVAVKDYPFPFIRDRADPAAIRYDYNGSGNYKYYFIATRDGGPNFQERFEIRSADTLEGLQTAADVSIYNRTQFNAHFGSTATGTFWAPELHVINGQLRILAAVSLEAYILTLEAGADPMDPAKWSIPERVLRANGHPLTSRGENVSTGISIDMTYFEDNGNHYYAWAARNTSGFWGDSHIAIAKLDPANPKRLTTEPAIIARPMPSYRHADASAGVVDEGPYVLKHNGRLFMTIASAATNETYAVTLMEGKPGTDLTDPANWTQGNYPILASAHVQGQPGPGHNSYVKDEYGRDVNVFHSGTRGSGRNTGLRTVHYDFEGEPVLYMTADRYLLPEYRNVEVQIVVGDRGAIPAANINAARKMASANNPVVQTTYTADPAPIVHDGVLYLYTGEDLDWATNSFRMTDWKCYSTTDMVNWTDHGSVLTVQSFTWTRQEWDANASHVIYNPHTKKFYFFASVHHTDRTNPRNTGIAIGVAVSDSPTGPFVDAIGAPLVTNGMTHSTRQQYGANHAWDDLDPCVFIDDDGEIYLMWGNAALYWATLSKDMLSLTSEIHAENIGDRSVFVGRFTEGPWLYKRGDLYYLAYAANFPETLDYLTGPSAKGPWTYGGRIIDNLGIGTNHPGIIDYKGNSYLFTHFNGLPGGQEHKRSVCVFKFEYDEKGKIPKIDAATLRTGGGVTQLEYLNPYTRVEAETIAVSHPPLGIKTERFKKDGRMSVTNIKDGNWIKVLGVDFGTSGASTYSANVACNTEGGAIELRLGSEDGTLIGTLPITNTGGSDNWKTLTTTVSGATGIHDLYMVFRGTPDKELFRFDYWQFAEKTDSSLINATLVNTSPETFCNPINISYRFQIDDRNASYRAMADVQPVYYQDLYWIFPTCASGYFYSTDLINWNFVDGTHTPQVNTYAPGAFVLNDYLYVGRFNEGIYKTNTPKDGSSWTLVRNTNYPDPYFYLDPDTKRLFVLHGCAGLTESNRGPAVRILELDTTSPTLSALPVDTTVPGATNAGYPVFYMNRRIRGYEVPGQLNNHYADDAQSWLEGPGVIKKDGKYYVYYCGPGTEYPGYSDGCFVADDPLGPYTWVTNSPFAYKGTGFTVGAAHGHTIYEQTSGRLWKFGTITISNIHIFERRVNLYPVGFNAAGEPIADLSFGDYPMYVPTSPKSSFDKQGPDWNLVSFGATATASSTYDVEVVPVGATKMPPFRIAPAKAFDESIRTWWSAETGNPGEWIMGDMGKIKTVNAVQVNFADQNPDRLYPNSIENQLLVRKHNVCYQYLLEYSEDGVNWITIADKSNYAPEELAKDYSHDYYELVTGIPMRYIRVTNKGPVPANGKFAISDIRLFGNGGGTAPGKVENFTLNRVEGRDNRVVRVSWDTVPDALGYMIRFGVRKDDLNIHRQVIGNVTEDIIPILSTHADDEKTKPLTYYFRIDTFNDSGRTIGTKIAELYQGD